MLLNGNRNQDSRGPGDNNILGKNVFETFIRSPQKPRNKYCLWSEKTYYNIK